MHLGKLQKFAEKNKKEKNRPSKPLEKNYKLLLARTKITNFSKK